MVALIFVGMSDNVGSDENGIPIEPLSQVISDVIIEHIEHIEPIGPIELVESVVIACSGIEKIRNSENE